MSKATITLRESGYKFDIDSDEFLAELAQHGDDPREYSKDVNDFEFSDSDDEKPEGWPEHLPTWSYRPAR